MKLECIDPENSVIAYERAFLLRGLANCYIGEFPEKAYSIDAEAAQLTASIYPENHGENLLAKKMVADCLLVVADEECINYYASGVSLTESLSSYSLEYVEFSYALAFAYKKLGNLDACEVSMGKDKRLKITNHCHPE